MEINILRFVSSILPPMKVDQASVREKIHLPRVSTFRSFVKPDQGAWNEPKDNNLVQALSKQKF